MKLQKLNKLLAGALCLCLFACDSNENPGENPPTDNGKVNPETVFTGKRFQQVGNMKMNYDSEGFLTLLEKGSTNVTFEYQTGSRNNLSAKSVIMTIIDKNYPDEKMVMNLVIGENSFVKECYETEYFANEQPEEEYWAFEYDTNGYLVQMKRSEGDNEVTKMVYKDGNLVSSSMTSDDPDNSQYSTIQYISDKVTESIENKGCIMCYDQTFGVDLDEMDYAFYAGLLGKATKHLPLSTTISSDPNDSNPRVDTHEWTLNQDGYPIKLTITSSLFPNFAEEEEFKW